MRVNPILCNGYGYCAEIVPELISLDDWGFPIVSSRPIEDENCSAWLGAPWRRVPVWRC
jgi:ferredoxin